MKLPLTSTLLCMKESSPAKRSCIRRRSSCLHGNSERMRHIVGQRVLGTSAGKSNKESINVSNTTCTSPRLFLSGPLPCWALSV